MQRDRVESLGDSECRGDRRGTRRHVELVELEDLLLVDGVVDRLDLRIRPIRRIGYRYGGRATDAGVRNTDKYRASRRKRRVWRYGYGCGTTTIVGPLLLKN